MVTNGQTTLGLTGLLRRQIFQLFRIQSPEMEMMKMIRRRKTRIKTPRRMERRIRKRRRRMVIRNKIS